MPAQEQLTAAERDKREIDPDFDFRELAENRPFETLTPNEIGMFKWSGVYHQLQKGFFMIRLRLPGGLINVQQLNKAAELADAYAQSRLCITTRQTLQFHWVRYVDIWKVLEGMKSVGVSTRNACGDVTRNVVTCPLAGICPHEEGDTLRILEAIADDPKLLNDYRNLPRKHKISVAGCGRACAQTLMNCQGWHPVRRHRDDGTVEVGWKLYAGGGLGARPVLGKPIFNWVPEELVVPVARAIAEAFHRHGDRRKRAYARLKFVVQRMGNRKFAETVMDILRDWGENGLEQIELAAEAQEGEILPSFLDGQTVIDQRQDGFCTVRVVVPRGELTTGQLREIAGLAQEYGDGSLIFTNRQNFQFRFVPKAKTQALLDQLRAAGWELGGHERAPDAVACVGTTMCNLAVADTPATYHRLISALRRDAKRWEVVGHLRIHMNGCPNSCAQHWIADIGLRGLRRREEEGSEEGFSIYAGGSLAGSGHIAEYVCDVSSHDTVAVVERLIDIYLAQRKSGESFGDFARRLGGDGLRKELSREPAQGVPLNRRNRHLQSLFHEAVRIAEQIEG